MEIQSETYFVLSRMSSEQRLFYCCKDNVTWLPEPEEAIRFCRELDARRTRDSIGCGALYCEVLQCHQQSTNISEPTGHTNQAQFCGMFNEKKIDPIPVDVYWSGDNDNFYSAFNRQGMGQDFYNTWINRYREFPVNRL